MFYHAGGNQSDAHKIASVGSIADDTGNKLRQAVGDVKQRRQQPNVAASQHAAGEDIRYGSIEALACEIEQRVAEPDGGQDMPPPVAVEGIHFTLISNERRTGRSFFKTKT